MIGVLWSLPRTTEQYNDDLGCMLDFITTVAHEHEAWRDLSIAIAKAEGK
jgi:hypothetical protein